MSSPIRTMSPVIEADITFTDIQAVLFDSPCMWRDSDSSDSGFGSSDSEAEVNIHCSNFDIDIIRKTRMVVTVNFRFRSK